MSTSDGSHNEFYTRFLSMTDPDSYCGRVSGGIIYAFIRRLLRQYHLEAIYCENDILHEVFLRAIGSQSKGRKIENLQAWIRGTSLNVIRELSRSTRKTAPLGEREIPDEIPAPLDQLTNKEEFNQELTALHKAFHSLRPLDREILVLKVIKGFSWQQVNNILEEGGFGPFTIAALRKRKQRVLDTLRIRLQKVDLDE